MIQMQTKLDVADNTGAKMVQCIHVLVVVADEWPVSATSSSAL